MNDDVFARRAARLEWLLLDVDGVLTDGALHYTRWGEQVKTFHVHDGLALKLAQRAGLKVGLLTGRRGRPLEQRVAELELDAAMLGERDKNAAFDGFLEQYHTQPARVAYIGDDLPDLPVLGRCALSFAPADAVAEVRAVVHTVLERPGGRAAAREAVELILKARGDWDRVLSEYSLET